MMKTNTRMNILISGLALAIFMSSLDTSVVNIVLPTLVKAFDSTFSEVQWVIISYMLAVTSLIVAVGRLGDLFDIKKVYGIGLAAFTIGSLICGLSPSIVILSLSRFVQGIGAAIIMALSFAIAQDACDKKTAVKAMTILTAMVSLGFAIGPTIGGTLIDLFGWRAIFFINVPLGVLSLLFMKVYRPDSAKSRDSFDYLGVLALIGTLFLFVSALQLAENKGFGNFLFFLLIMGAVIFLFAFFTIEKKVQHPLIPFSLWSDRLLTASLIVSILVYSNLNCVQVIAPFFLKGVSHLSDAQIGLVFSAGPAATTLFGFLAGWLMHHTGPAKLMGFGIIAILIGDFTMTLLSSASGAWGYVWRIIIINGGLAFFQTPNNAVVMQKAPDSKRGLYSSMLGLGRNLGLTVGASVMSSLFAMLAYAYTPAKEAMSMPRPLIFAYHQMFLLLIAITAVSFFILCAGFYKRRGRDFESSRTE
ncbi:MFS transporter [Sporolactobacillus sp. CQH2019]|uniref:MFS transporter n=1 Tax=Sporolactobacillus sp. CQH2019 TaxID=3023512 RepID=UPI0023680FDF|nr:MFS transporter [Sporolactobacillus sp. CQH2019]MDD9150233.1 MFS transporter [Sporolactobacillus sp. CQH2019]